MTAPSLLSLEQLSGLVERVTFLNADSGFCVLRLKVRGERDLVTLVGRAPSVKPGEYASASGGWVTDREHGRQFKAVFVKMAPPNTLSGIERYLGTGMVKGIGPVYASRPASAFGTGVFDVIEQTPERLREIDGDGEKRARKITSGWADQKVTPGDYGVPARSRRIDLPRGADLQDLWPRSHRSRSGEPISARRWHPGHRLPVRRQDRAGAHSSRWLSRASATNAGGRS